jgi:hypothetical protein
LGEIVEFRLPDSPLAFDDATWSDVAPYYEALAIRPLDQGNVEPWLADEPRLSTLLPRVSISWLHTESQAGFLAAEEGCSH